MSHQSIIIVVILTFPSVIEASRCSDVKYNTIDDPRRSTAYSNFSSPKLCDRNIIRDNVWYRFSSEAGGEMPTTKPPLKTCGTYVPIWLRGVHPTIKEGAVRRKACANVPGIPPFGCGFSYNIQVRNCSGFYIYKLKRPSHCYFAYCAGSKVQNCKDARPADHCLENRPPYISMFHRYYALKDSKFQLPFTAFDPEGYPMRYSYLSNTTIKSVSIDYKRKFVNISVKESGSVSLKVTDYEGLEYVHTVEIVTLRCICENAGICHNRNIAATSREGLLALSCVCPKPYTGKFCEVHPCDNNPCFRGVSCSIKGDSYECGKCPNNFEGDGKYCQLVTDDTTNVAGAEMTIVSGLKWDKDLLNKSSRLYKEQAITIERLLTEAFISANAGPNVFITGYRKGSVVVEFQVVFKKKMDDPLRPLRRCAMQNNFRIFKVDPKSVKEEKLAEIEGTVNVESGLEWKDNLLNKSSSYFKITSSKIANEINKIYAFEKDFVYVFVTGFRKQNFVVEFKLVWRKKVENSLEKLKRETKDGKLGELSIDKGSVKQKSTNMSSGDSSYSGLHKAEFIALMCIVSLVALLFFVVCGICIRRKHNNVMVSSHRDQYKFFSDNSSEVLSL